MSSDRFLERAREIVSAWTRDRALTMGCADLIDAFSAELRATAEAARRDERQAIWKSVMHRIEHNSGHAANAMRALSGWICSRGEDDTPSPTDLAALKEAVVEAGVPINRNTGLPCDHAYVRRHKDGSWTCDLCGGPLPRLEKESAS